MSILTIAGSPSASSRSAFLVQWAAEHLSARGLRVSSLAVRDLPAEDLLHARFDSPAVKAAVARVAESSGVIVATPIYKAAYAGALKVFLDLLPQDGLAGKVVLPVASGGSVAHALAIDYALRPVLAALGAKVVIPGVYVEDRQISGEGGDRQLADDVRRRLAEALDRFEDALGWSSTPLDTTDPLTTPA